MNAKAGLSLGFNIAIGAMAIVGAVFAYLGVNLTGQDYTAKGAVVFFLFTYQSNILMIIPSSLIAFYDILFLLGKRKDIPAFALILKLCLTVGVTITFLVVLFFIAPANENGFLASYANSNLLFHLLLPLSAITSFVFFEKTDKISFRHIPLGLIHTTVYMIAYSVLVFTHLNGGAPDPFYDFYGFFRPGLWVTPINVFVFSALAFFVSLILWRLNKVRRKS